MIKTGDVVKKIDSSKLNVNIRDELTKQIDFLQKGILNITETKNKREYNQNSEIFKKTRENAALIKQLNQKKKAYCELEKEYLTIKSDFSALKKKYEQLQRSEKMNTINNNTNAQLSQTMYNFSNNLPNIKKEDDKFANTLYKVKDTNDMMNRTERKSWKDGKLYKGNSLSMSKDTRNDAYKLSEIKKILEEKNEIIRRQRIEIQILQNNLAATNKKDSNMGYTTYGVGFKVTSDADH